MKKITVYEAEDGKTFRSEEECRNHEEFCGAYSDLSEIWKKYHPETDYCPYCVFDIMKEESFIKDVCSKFNVTVEELRERIGYSEEDDNFLKAFSEFKYNHILSL